MKNRSGLIKIILSLVLLAVVLAQLNLHELWHELQTIDLGLFGLSVLAYLMGIGIRAYRWQLLFRALGGVGTFHRERGVGMGRGPRL